MILSKYSNVRHSMLLIVWEAKRPINLLHFSMNRKFHKIISQQRIGHIQIYRNALLDSCLFFQYFGYLKYGRIVYREMSQTEHISSCQCRPIDLKAESLLPTNEKPLDLLRPAWSYFKSCFGWTELHTRLKFHFGHSEFNIVAMLDCYHSFSIQYGVQVWRVWFLHS